MSLQTSTAYARIAALRSPETAAALEALTAFSATNPDPRDPANAEHQRRLDAAYLEASMADGTFYLLSIGDSERWAAEADEKALGQTGFWADRYRQSAANHRWAADQAREKLAETPAGRILSMKEAA